jgi:hypothetical protein
MTIKEKEIMELEISRNTLQFEVQRLKSLKENRETDLAIDRLQEAVFWLKSSLERSGVPQKWVNM